MVTVLFRQRHGFDVRIYTKDHQPAHAHVWKGEKNIRINLKTLEVEQNRGYNTGEIQAIRRLVIEHQQLLLDVWNLIHEQGDSSG